MNKFEQTSSRSVDEQPMLVERDSSNDWMGMTLVMVVFLVVCWIFMNNNSVSRNNQLDQGVRQQQSIIENRQLDTQQQQAATAKEQQATALQQSATQARQQSAPERGQPGAPGVDGVDDTSTTPETDSL
ncbi:MAG: hypothetical protein K2Z81_13695 [Cyanobacteria bacterium]|nr:hypothetical protein [Cyanobacteriota bacterium]